MRMLDLFCCQGGAAVGYARAGWTVTGVELENRHAARYPYEVVVGDALAYVAEHGHEYDAIHASPPCQCTPADAPPTAVSRRTGSAPSRRCVRRSRPAGLPYVIENVKDAGWDLVDPVTLCGCMFDLSTIDTDGVQIHLQRPRLFEANWNLTAPRPCDHSTHDWVAGAYGGARRDKYEAKYVRRGGYVPPDKAVVKALLGIEHDVTWEALYESVPPAYTEDIGRQLAAHLTSAAA